MFEPRQPDESSVATNLLGEVAIFQSFSAQEKEALFTKGRIEEHESGANVVIEGESSRGLYIILSGQVSVFKNNQSTGQMHRLTYLEGGDNFGELSLLEDSPRAATIVAETKVRLFCLDQNDFDQFLFAGGDTRQANFYRCCTLNLVERFRRQNNDYIEAQQLLWQHALRRPDVGVATEVGSTKPQD